MSTRSKAAQAKQEHDNVPKLSQEDFDKFHPRALELLEDIAVFAEKHPAANRPNYASGALSGESRKFLQELQKMPEPDFLTLEKKQELEKVCNVLRGAKGSLHATARKMENAVGIKLTNPYFGPGSMSMNACHFIPESIDYLTSAITTVENLLRIPVKRQKSEPVPTEVLTPRKAKASSGGAGAGAAGYVAKTAVTAVTAPVARTGTGASAHETVVKSKSEGLAGSLLASDPEVLAQLSPQAKSALKSFARAAKATRSVSNTKSKSAAAGLKEEEADEGHGSGFRVPVKTVDALPPGPDGVVRVSTAAGTAGATTGTALKASTKSGGNAVEPAAPAPFTAGKKPFRGAVEKPKPARKSSKKSKSKGEVPTALVYTDTPEYWRARSLEVNPNGDNAKGLLYDWLIKHFDSPFADRATKELLGELTGKTVKQINHWLVNARGRKWKPLVQEFAGTANVVLDVQGGGAGGGAGPAPTKKSTAIAAATTRKLGKASVALGAPSARTAAAKGKGKKRREENSDDEEDELGLGLPSLPVIGLAAERSRRITKSVNYREQGLGHDFSGDEDFESEDFEGDSDDELTDLDDE